jgi:uncharacterized membrane protein YphA (DoxX/SURF4 family)
MSRPVLQPIPTSGPFVTPEPWSLSHRIIFRFVCCYLLLYCLPINGHANLIQFIPGSYFVADPYIKLWHTICPWVAIHIFHLSGKPTTYFLTGSGDTTLDYIQHLCFLATAVIASLVWSLLDRKRIHYVVLRQWLTILVRYTLAITMLSYGFAKLFPTQFRFPDPSRLMEPFGEFSPMGVLWNFMGTSLVYTSLTGTVEVMGGALLLFQRTTTLGAIVSAGAMLNVLVLNFCYDVPVKLYSSNLLLMAILLISPDLRRIANVLVLKRPTEPDCSPQIRFSKRWMRIAAVGIKVLLIGCLVFESYYAWNRYDNLVRRPQRSLLYGLYEVEKFVENGVERPPVTTDALRWRKVAVGDIQSLVAVRTMDDSIVRYRLAYEAAKNKTLTLSDGNAPYNDATARVRFVFSYAQPDADHVSLKNDHLSVIMRRVDTSKFLLVSRGFHWINELPFNR